MKLTLGRDAEQIIRDQLNSRRFADAESVVLAGLKSLAARGADEFAPGELAKSLEEGEKSIAQDGTLDGDEAFEARRARRRRRNVKA
jgi:Arc/MetJ-type ribon-helix-helix transcriptional regulator